MSSKPEVQAEYLKYAAVLTAIVSLALGLFLIDGGNSLTNLMSMFMASFMSVFASFKIVSYKQFMASFKSYDIIAKRWSIYAWIFPWLQLTLGLSYLFSNDSLARDSLVALMASLAAVGVWQAITSQATKPQCACLGSVIKLPLSKLSLAEDLLMVLMVLAIQL